MATLLCLVPNNESPYNHGRTVAALTSRWKDFFERIDVISRKDGQQNKLPGPQDPYTHLWVMGNFSFISSLVQSGVSTQNFKNTLVYYYTLISTPFVDMESSALGAHADFVITMSDMANQAYRYALTASDSVQVDKLAYVRAKNSGVIPPGIDTTIFRPSNIHAGGFSKSELRESLFGDKIPYDHLFVIGTGSFAPTRGYAQWFAIVRQLIKAHPKTKAYIHTPINNILVKLALGNDLTPGVDVFFRDSLTRTDVLSDAQLAQLYQSADVYLNTSTADAWPYGLTEAMACGTLGAAPDDHVWADVVRDQRGIELPATTFAPAFWDQNIYVRSVDCAESARRILETYLNTETRSIVQESGIHWAHASTEASWDRIATGWLNMFGVL